MTAEMATKFVGSDQNVFVLHYLLEWYALWTYYWIVFCVINQQWNFDILYHLVSRVIFLVRLKAFFFVHSPIYFFFNHIDSFDAFDKLFQVKVVFLLENRGQVLLVLLILLLVPLAEIPIYQTIPASFEVVHRL